ncbi:MAG TPA: DUF5009 domain-containing protein [Candidatus Hydrogenedentes bacterium]|nr:DUF5009 domain-containing protein [Candidatus Hydrogenedentota bacterium]HNT86560.1 DUF5009 domain-containing protein [Candidatus Hydrogenedentota bacterium]
MPAQETAAKEAAAAPERVMSVDALRGFDMFWIIGGQGLVVSFLRLFMDPLHPVLDEQLKHAAWEGFTAWDLIMPLFLFIVGTSMAFSFDRRVREGQSLKHIYLKILRRFVLLWVFGMMVQGNLLEFDLSKLHVFSNTLQAIAVGYLIAAVALLHLPLAAQVAVAGALLGVYWLLMMFVPTPGHGGPVLEPKANLALYIDELILGRFRDGTTYTWILSSLGFTATTLLGVFAGRILKAQWNAVLRLLALVAMGGACLAGGWYWSCHFPIIKHVWSSTMVLWAAGLSCLLLAFFYLVIDVIKFRIWAVPFVVIGMNAIAAYVGAHVLPIDAIGTALAGGLAKHFLGFGAFLLAVVNFAVVWFVLYYMYRNKTFLKV